MQINNILIVVTLLLTGCAAQVISSSERTVIVKARVQDVAEAQKIADSECAKYNRHARLSIKATINQYVYDCVE